MWIVYGLAAIGAAAVAFVVYGLVSWLRGSQP